MILCTGVSLGASFSQVVWAFLGHATKGRERLMQHCRWCCDMWGEQGAGEEEPIDLEICLYLWCHSQKFITVYTLDLHVIDLQGWDVPIFSPTTFLALLILPVFQWRFIKESQSKRIECCSVCIPGLFDAKKNISCGVSSSAGCCFPFSLSSYTELKLYSAIT